MNCMKKFFIISVVCTAIILVLAVLLNIILIGKTNSYVDGQYVENGYNNFVFNNGNLVRIDDRLYYNYNETNDLLNYGLYEISEAGCEKIKVTENFVLSDGLYGMQGYNDLLLIGPADSDNKIEAYSIKDKSFSSYALIDGSFEKQIKQYYSFGDTAYAVTGSDVYKISDGTVDKIMDRSAVRNLNEQPYSDETDVFCGMYFTKDKIFYIDAKSGRMCRFDTDSRETQKLFDIEAELQKQNLSAGHLDYQFLVVRNYLIFLCSEETTTWFYTYDLQQNNIQKIDMDFDGLTQINVFNGQLVLSNDDNGLYTYDLENQTLNKLSDLKAAEIYVVDDKYIYYKNPSRRLYRINPDSGKTEKIM